MSARVVITGMGAVSAAGVGVTAFFEALQQARPCLGPLPMLAEMGLSFRLAGSVGSVGERSQRHDPVTHFALLAAKEALGQAGAREAPLPRDSLAVIIGTAGGGLSSIDEGYRAVHLAMRQRPAPLTVPLGMASAPVGAVCAELGGAALAFATSSACASAGHAIGLGLWLVRQGICRAAIVGGSEAPLVPGHLRAWEAMRAVSPDTCRPFSRDRRGMILGEGAAVFVLESEAHARERGATPLVELAGFGSNAGTELVVPEARSMALAMHRALADAAMSAEAIDYVQAHGTGTPRNDAAEAAAIFEVFGVRASAVPVSSIKGAIGHTIGASGGLSLCAAVLAIRHGFAPPTLNFVGPDPACALDVVPHEARALLARAALCNNFAFGALDTALVVRALA